MRKILVLAILSVFAVFAVGAEAASAKPVKKKTVCSASIGVSNIATFYGGYPWIDFSVGISQCSNTDGIQISNAGSGWYDTSSGFKQMNGINFFGGDYGAPQPIHEEAVIDSPCVGCNGASISGITWHEYGIGTCWFSGTRLGYTQLKWRWHQHGGGWSAYVTTYSAAHNVTCP